MTTETKRWTYEEYLNGPEIKARYEIIDGEMIMPPAPTYRHQAVLGQIYWLFRHFLAGNPLGQIVFAPVDIVIQENPLRTRQPDLVFLRNENPADRETVIHGAPDLLVEVLSPSNYRTDIEGKLVDYFALGVPECWLVSPEASTVEVLHRREEALARVALYGLGDYVESTVLPALRFPVVEIFRD